MALSLIGDPIAVEPLIAKLKRDSNGAVVKTLGKIGGTRLVNLLIALIKNDDDSIYIQRVRSIDALGEIGDSRAVEPLIAAHKDSMLRRQAAEALGKIGDPRAVEPLIPTLRDDFANQTAKALAEIAKASCKTGDLRAINLLITALKDYNKNVRSGALMALRLIGDPLAVEPLIAALKDDDSDVSCVAACALGEIGDPRTVEPLIAALKDDDSDVSCVAACVLGEAGDSRAIPVLVKALRYWNTNQHVASILSRLSWKPKTNEDIVHFWVAERKKSELRNNWNLTKTILLKDIESNNYRTIENALFAFIGIGKQEILHELVSKLNTKGNKTMAEAYLNCGHKELDKAARNWAASRGYYIQAGHGSNPVNWGNM